MATADKRPAEPAPSRSDARRTGGWAPFGVAGSALFVLLLGSNLPTPLFPMYAKVYGLSPLGVSLLLPPTRGWSFPLSWSSVHCRTRRAVVNC